MNRESGIHRMRRPGLKDDEILAFNRAGDLGQHPAFRRFNHFPTVQTERLVGDDVKHQSVGSGFDAIHFLVELIRELLQVGEVMNPRVIDIIGHAEGVFRPFQVDVDALDRAILFVGRSIGHHGGVPVSQKYIQIFTRQGLIDHWQTQNVGFDLISQGFQDHGGRASGQGQIIPARFGHADGAAGLGVGGQCGL